MEEHLRTEERRDDSGLNRAVCLRTSEGRIGAKGQVQGKGFVEGGGDEEMGYAEGLGRVLGTR